MSSVSGAQREDFYTDYGMSSLLKELQIFMYKIARSAELQDSNLFQMIEAEAAASLRIIDSFLYASQIEVGQTELKLEPLALGSVMHSVFSDMWTTAEQRVELKIGVNQPVVSDPLLLRTLLFSVSQFVAEVSGSPLNLRSFTSRSGAIGVGVFSHNFTLTPKEFKRQLASSGSSAMPFAQYSSGSGFLILLADRLAHILGTSLQVKRMGKLNGFAIEVPKSLQLAFV